MSKGLDILIDGEPASAIVARALKCGDAKRRTTPEPTEREIENLQQQVKKYQKKYKQRLAEGKV